MKLYRFMSFDEFTKLTAGCDIVGRKRYAARTSSTGVCFMKEEVPCRDYVIHPEGYLSFLSGIVCDDVMVEFECNCDVTDSWGVYADPSFDADYYDTFDVNEVCVPSYNRETMIPVRYYIPHSLGKGTWYTVN